MLTAQKSDILETRCKGITLALIISLIGGCASTPAPAPAPSPSPSPSPSPKIESSSSSLVKWTDVGPGVEFKVLPKVSSKNLYTTRSNKTYRVVRIQANWVAVVDDEGTIGWMPVSVIKSARAEPPAVAQAKTQAIRKQKRPDSNQQGIDRQPSLTEANKTIFRFDIDVAMLSKTQTFRSTGSGVTGNYEIKKTAPALVLLGAVRKNFGNYQLGLESEFQQTVSGQITTPDAAGSKDLSWASKTVDLRVLGIYRFGPSFFLAGSMGYRVNSYEIDQDINVKLPAEKLSGFTLGTRIIAPRFSKNSSMSLGVDWLLSGSVEQTEGFTDGNEIEISGQTIRASLQHDWTPSLALSVTYSFSNEDYEFSGPSERNVGILSGTRKDSAHLFGIGLSHQF